MDGRGSATARFFGRVVYSSSNEDGASERRALRLGGGDAAVTVLGSGARAFELLIDSGERADSRPSAAGEVVAVDQNVHQCALAHLKVASYSLPYDAFAGFLGLREMAPRERVNVYRCELRGGLGESWQTYWDAREALVARGVIYCGTWESYFRWFARAARAKGGALRALFEAQSLEEQVEIWRTRWCDRRWRFGLWAFGRRGVWKYILREPGIERIDPSLDIAGTLGDRFDRCAQTRLFRDTPYLYLLLRGRYDEAGPFPDHLSEAYYEKVQAGLWRLRIECASLAPFLEAHRGRFDAFSLSDVSSYADVSEHRRIWKAVLAAARPGARVCERYFLSDGAEAELDALSEGRFQRESSMEVRLESEDDTFLYRFRCGVVTP